MFVLSVGERVSLGDFTLEAGQAVVWVIVSTDYVRVSLGAFTGEARQAGG